MKTKELTIEEKAKAYDEVLERAKELLEVGLKDTRDKRVILSFFPELAKSEDERIREKVIATIHLYYGEPLEDEAKEMIYWLEKQGEQTAEWSKEDERNFDIIYGIIYNSCIAEDASRLIEWLKSLKDRVQPQPQQEWSEEDEKFFKTALWHISYSISNGKSTDVNCDTTDWFKSLKDRVQPQPKNEWSKEDEDIKDSIIHQLKMLRGDRNVTEGNKKEIEWLKSLRPQNTWKPSEEQMYNLSEAAHYRTPYWDCDILIGLYYDLKKLREE